MALLPENWFNQAFGFNESQNYAVNQTRFIDLFNKGTINGIDVGSFKLVSRTQLPSPTDCKFAGKVTLTHLIGDVVKLHSTCQANTTFQVASQFNCLEMVNPNILPEDGITRYQQDHTQGPLCAMCTPAGLVYRQYLYRFDDGTIGQTKSRQIDMSRNARLAIAKITSTGVVSGRFHNGYLFYTDDELNKINKSLIGISPNAINNRRGIRNLIEVGVHQNLGVCINGKKYNHHVNHVYCSGLPISYNKVNPIKWLGLSELFLESAYENTLLTACQNNSKICYITLVGGGVFGMNIDQIYRAIERACILTAREGGYLNVVLVHHNKLNENLKKFGFDGKVFYGNEIFDQSIWDTTNWLK